MVCTTITITAALIINSIKVTINPETYTNKGSEGWHTVAVDATGTGTFIIMVDTVEKFRINASGNAIYRREIQFDPGTYNICAEVV